MGFKLKVRKVNDVPVLDILGEVSGPDIAKITSRLDSMRKENSTVIAIDMSHTSYIDSHGMGALVFFWRVLEEEQRQLVFIKPQSFIRNMLSGTNLDKIFRVVDSEEELQKNGVK
jgi:anti-anti-sigma factor